jgi:hypothetical protein
MSEEELAAERESEDAERSGRIPVLAYDFSFSIHRSAWNTPSPRFAGTEF